MMTEVFVTTDDYGQPVQWLGTSYTVERKEEKTFLLILVSAGYKGSFMDMLNGIQRSGCPNKISYRSGCTE